MGLYMGLHFLQSLIDWWLIGEYYHCIKSKTISLLSFQIAEDIYGAELSDKCAENNRGKLKTFYLNSWFIFPNTVSMND